VTLDADAVEQAEVPQRFHQPQRALELRPGLDAVIIVEQTLGRVGLAGEAEGLHDVVGNPVAVFIATRGAMPAAVDPPTTVVRDRLVHRVPARHPATVPREQRPHVAPQAREHDGPRVGAGQRLVHPGGSLPVPQERVAAHAHPVRRGEGDDGVGVGELVRGFSIAFGGVDPLPLHGVLADEPVHVLAQEVSVRGNGPRFHGSPDGEERLIQSGERWHGVMVARFPP
jgi:hypothetical protein